jgi:hypothetical protein
VSIDRVDALLIASQPLTGVQARRFAATIVEAADELDRLNAGGH